MVSAGTGDDKAKLNSIGKYQIIGTLGRGSMGVVYKARDPEIGRIVAVKTLRKVAAGQFHDDAGALERFRLEARSAGNLRHPNIVTVFDVNIQDDIPYIVMDYVEGESLDRVIASCRLRKDLLLYYLKQISAGLDAAHAKGVIHRDIKPSNIIVDKSENCYLADFGVASFSESLSEEQDKSDSIMGTPGYMAPEQILNKRLDHRTDLFSLAVVAFECFAGQRPFPGTTFTEVLSNILNSKPLSLTALADLPLSLEAEFERALAKKPEERFDSGEAMVAAFAKALGIERIEKPALSLIPGQERGANRAESEGEWKTVVVAEKAEKKEEPAPAGQEAIGKLPNVPLYSTDSSGTGEYVGGGWDQPQNLETVHLPVPGEMFAHVKSPIGTGIGELLRRRRRMIRITAVMLLICAALGTELFFTLAAKQGSGVRTTEPDAANSWSEPNGVAEEPLELQVDPAPSGKLAAEMSNRELLGLLLSSESEEDQVLNGLREAQHRKIPELVEAARTLLFHDSYMVRTEMIKVLRDLGDKRSVPLLVEALNDHDPLVRGTAANALGALGSRKALGYLSASYQTEDVPEVKIALKRAIEKINGYPVEE